MILANNSFTHNLDLSAEGAYVLEIHQPRLLQRTVQSLIALGEGKTPLEPFLLHDGLKPQSAEKLLTVWSDPFHIDLNSRKLQGRIIERLEALLTEDPQRFARWELAADEAAEVIREVSQSLQSDVQLAEEITCTDFCKLLNVRIACNENDELPTRMLHLLDAASEWLRDQVLVLFNLLHYYTAEQRDELFKYAAYVKVRLLLVEPRVELPPCPYETRWIIHENFDDEIVKRCYTIPNSPSE